MVLVAGRWCWLLGREADFLAVKLTAGVTLVADPGVGCLTVNPEEGMTLDHDPSGSDGGTFRAADPVVGIGDWLASWNGRDLSDP